MSTRVLSEVELAAMKRRIYAKLDAERPWFIFTDVHGVEHRARGKAWGEAAIALIDRGGFIGSYRTWRTEPFRGEDS